jgi:RNA polymerase sigma-70 factor (ECF subfamily)
VKAWRSYDRFNAELGSERTWLFAIIRNTIVDMARARGVRPRLSPAQTQDHEGASIEVQVDRLIEAWLVEEALRRLSEDHREALLAVHASDRDYATVAAELGIPPGTLKSRVYYGLRAMRLALDELGWSDDE